jgi:hypothetical protein
VIKEGIIIRPKFYAIVGIDLKEKVKIKGIQKNIKCSGLKCCLDYMRFKNIIENPIVIFDKFTKFKESIRRGFDTGEIIEISKHLDIEDTKRYWGTDFKCDTLYNSIPLDLNDSNMMSLLEIKEKEREARIKRETETIINT